MIWSFYQFVISCYILIHTYDCYQVLASGSAAKTYLNDDLKTRLWAIKVKDVDKMEEAGREEKVDRVALELQMRNLGEISGQLPPHYMFAAPNFTDIEPALRHHPDIEWHQRQELNETQQEGCPDFTDPLYSKQGHLVSTNTTLLDCNVKQAWCQGINGEGVVVAIVDDGVEWQHDDLKDNYLKKGSKDFVDNDNDPTPSLGDVHGTQCAGVSSAVGYNNICGVGVAYKSKFSAIRVKDNNRIVTDAKIAEALNFELNTNHIYSCSFAPLGDGETYQGLSSDVEKAFKKGTTDGRNSYGSIFVFSSGDDKKVPGDCNYNKYLSSIHVIPVAAVTENGVTPPNGERCTCLMTSTLTGISTTTTNTNERSGCSNDFGGTAASAALVSGIIALMLQERPTLSWRDVHHIISMTSSHVTLSREVDLFQPNSPSRTSVFQKNQANFTYNDYHGFGFLDTRRVVNAARVWRKVPDMVSVKINCPISHLPSYDPKDNAIDLRSGMTVAVTCHTNYKKYVLSIENIVVGLRLVITNRTLVEYVITCPSGTQSMVTAQPHYKSSSTESSKLVIRTVKCWGESPLGVFKLKLRSLSDENTKVALEYMTVHGSEMTSHDLSRRWKEVESSYNSFDIPDLNMRSRNLHRHRRKAEDEDKDKDEDEDKDEDKDGNETTTMNPKLEVKPENKLIMIAIVTGAIVAFVLALYCIGVIICDFICSPCKSKVAPEKGPPKKEDAEDPAE